MSRPKPNLVVATTATGTQSAMLLTTTRLAYVLATGDNKMGYNNGNCCRRYCPKRATQSIEGTDYCDDHAAEQIIFENKLRAKLQEKKVE
jgi:hypothetical protein